jgi:tetratricopeptide (TPR) repeat protein
VKTAEPPPKPAVAVVEKAPEPPPKPAVAVAEKAPEPPPVVAPPVVEKRVAKAEPSYESAVTEPAPRHRSRTLGGKKVVLEDDKSAPVEPKEDPAQVERARDAYKRGNEKLFAGNSAGAIEAYKESLSIYPGYVAGYRGLGLAYAQEGNNADALKALKTYVKNAPNAHDVPLIMKRIERLEKSPQD